MNLYVWEGVLEDYYGGLAFAIADSLEDAIDVLIQSNIEEDHNPDHYSINEMRKELTTNSPKIFDLTKMEKPIGFYQEGGG
jgi:hypothetical protein